jgi:hypothetical protein
MKKLLSTLCIIFALTSCTLFSKKNIAVEVRNTATEKWNQPITFNIPAVLSREYCSNADWTHNNSPDVQCFHDIAGAKSLTIIKTVGDLSTAVYSDPSAWFTYKFYSEYDRWIEDFIFNDPQYHKNVTDCLQSTMRKSISLNVIPKIYADGGEFECEQYLEKNTFKWKEYVFLGWDGPGVWNTVFVESSDKKNLYQIKCMTNFGGQEPPVFGDEWLFLEECINTVLSSFPNTSNN